MKQRKVINLKSDHYEIDGNDLVFYGDRGSDENRYIVRISFSFPLISALYYLSKICIKRMREEKESIHVMLCNVKHETEK